VWGKRKKPRKKELAGGKNLQQAGNKKVHEKSVAGNRKEEKPPILYSDRMVRKRCSGEKKCKVYRRPNLPGEKRIQ